MTGPKKAALELFIQLVSLSGGYLIHVFFHRWELVLVVVLALECFLHLISLIWIYRHTLDTLSEWAKTDLNPLIELKGIKSEIQFLRDNAIPLQYALPGPRDWPFDELFKQTVENFKRDTHLISEGSYTLLMEDIQDVSLKVCAQMEHGAFCTALEENLNIFDTPRGVELLSKQYAAANDLATSQNMRNGFTRLFLFDDINRISWQHFQLMKENHQNCIEVLVAAKRTVSSIFKRFELENRMDFGKWKHNLLMEIVGTEPERRLHVTKKDEDIRNANSLIRELRSASYDYAEFLSRFKVGINIRLWSTEPEAALLLDVPDGPHESDCDNMFKVAVENNKDIKRIAIYGLTQKLFERTNTLASKAGSNITSIDVIDARYYAPQIKSTLLNFIKENWFDWSPTDYKYDVIFADDALCNLTVWQTPLFFEHVAQNLNPGGLFIFRATAKFSPGLVDPTWDDIIAEFQQFDRNPERRGSRLSLDMLSPGVVYEMAWPVLHTDRFYDESSCSLSFGAWNEAVRRDPRISVNLKNRLTFNRPLRLTSMEYQELRTMWKPYFKVAQAELPAYSRWENDETLAEYSGAKEVSRRFHEYYRLVVLQKY